MFDPVQTDKTPLTSFTQISFTAAVDPPETHWKVLDKLVAPELLLLLLMPVAVNAQAPDLLM